MKNAMDYEGSTASITRVSNGYLVNNAVGSSTYYPTLDEALNSVKETPGNNYDSN